MCRHKHFCFYSPSFPICLGNKESMRHNQYSVFGPVVQVIFPTCLAMESDRALLLVLVTGIWKVYEWLQLPQKKPIAQGM